MCRAFKMCIINLPLTELHGRLDYEKHFAYRSVKAGASPFINSVAVIAASVLLIVKTDISELFNCPSLFRLVPKS